MRKYSLFLFYGAFMLLSTLYDSVFLSVPFVKAFFRCTFSEYSQELFLGWGKIFKVQILGNPLTLKVFFFTNFFPLMLIKGYHKLENFEIIIRGWLIYASLSEVNLLPGFEKDNNHLSCFKCSINKKVFVSSIHGS